MSAAASAGAVAVLAAPSRPLATGLAAVLAGVATAVAVSSRTSASDRLATLVPTGARAVDPPVRRSRSVVRLVAAVASAAGVVAVLGAVGVVPAIVVGVGVHRAVPTEAAVAAAADERRIRAQAPLACDVLAAALGAGSPVIDAVALAAVAVDGPLGRLLGDVAALLQLGAAPAEAWAAVERSPPLRPVARAAIRSASSGAALAGALTALADDLRQAAHADGQVAARRAGVRLVGPLTLCFLPSFVVLGVVPLVLGLLPDVLR